MKIAFIVVYLVVAIAMIAFIMLQRGSGAAAGSGFGSGASGTVFGARGSANFLSKSTKWLAVTFFVLSMAMAVYEARVGTKASANADLGVMGQLPTPTQPTPAAPASTGEVPTATEATPTATTSSEVPAASAPAEAPSATPDAAPSAAAPAPQTSETPAADAAKDEGKPQ